MAYPDLSELAKCQRTTQCVVGLVGGGLFAACKGEEQKSSPRAQEIPRNTNNNLFLLDACPPLSLHIITILQGHRYSIQNAVWNGDLHCCRLLTSSLNKSLIFNQPASMSTTLQMPPPSTSRSRNNRIQRGRKCATVV